MGHHGTPTPTAESTPSPLPSPHHLRSSSGSGRRPQVAGSPSPSPDDEDEEEYHNDETVITDHYIEELLSSTDNEADNCKPDPTTQMLVSVGLLVVPVDDDISVLVCIACQGGIKPSSAISHLTSRSHKLKISKQT